MDWYVLDGKKPVKEPDLLKAAAAMEKADRVVAKTKVGRAEVSTVFLGLDHGWNGKPALFETMIFDLPDGHELSEYQARYSTWEEAEEGHKQAVKLLNNR